MGSKTRWFTTVGEDRCLRGTFGTPAACGFRPARSRTVDQTQQQTAGCLRFVVNHSLPLSAFSLITTLWYTDPSLGPRMVQLLDGYQIGRVCYWHGTYRVTCSGRRGSGYPEETGKTFGSIKRSAGDSLMIMGLVTPGCSQSWSFFMTEWPVILKCSWSWLFLNGCRAGYSRTFLKLEIPSGCWMCWFLRPFLFDPRDGQQTPAW